MALSVVGDSRLDLEEITALTGLAPSRAWRLRDPSPEAVELETMPEWRFQLGPTLSAELPNQVEALLSHFVGHVVKHLIAYQCYIRGMARERVSTTVDAEVLSMARSLRAWTNDASLLDAALHALVAAHRATEINSAYRAYDEQPLDEPDEWGDLQSFRAAAGSS